MHITTSQTAQPPDNVSYTPSWRRGIVPGISARMYKSLIDKGIRSPIIYI